MSSSDRQAAETVATPSAPPAAEQGRVARAAARADRPSALVRVLDTGAGRNLGLIAVLVVLCVIGVATTDTFATTSNLLTILTSASIIGVITVGVTIVIIGRGIDLSVGKVMALASVWSTTVATQSYGPVVMVFCALAVGAGCGLVNGVLIAYGRIVPFIATLAMLISAQGLAERISGKRSQIVTDPTIAAIASTRVLGVPLLVYVFAALTTTGSSTHGTLYELDAIAAVIIGGTLLTGGRGTLIGSILGVLVFTAITNLFILNNLATEVQNNIAKA